jgi:hypothetical protein
MMVGVTPPGPEWVEVLCKDFAARALLKSCLGRGDATIWSVPEDLR